MTPRCNIEVIGSRESILLNALIDTGFDGDLCLPVPVAVSLGFELVGQEAVEYADGRRDRQLVFVGLVSFLGEERPANIVLTNGGDTLIGTGLFEDKTVTIDFATGEIHIVWAR